MRTSILAQIFANTRLSRPKPQIGRIEFSPTLCRIHRLITLGERPAIDADQAACQNHP
jgi:hypothetical protein